MSQFDSPGSAPATADVDPANLSGPGVTSAPDPADVRSVGDVADENARLRAQLLAENERLRTALADSQASGLTAQGLSDEDVRRLEHPEEFMISNDELHARLAELESASGRVQDSSRATVQPAPRQTVGVTGSHRDLSAAQAGPVDPATGARDTASEGDAPFGRTAGDASASWGTGADRTNAPDAQAFGDPVPLGDRQSAAAGAAQGSVGGLGTTTGRSATDSGGRPFTDNGDGTWTDAQGRRGRFGPDGFRPE